MNNVTCLFIYCGVDVRYKMYDNIAAWLLDLFSIIFKIKRITASHETVSNQKQIGCR